MIVETDGTGLMKIADSYKNSTVKHKLEVTEQAFKITLPFRPEVMNGFKLRNKMVAAAAILHFIGNSDKMKGEE